MGGSLELLSSVMLAWAEGGLMCSLCGVHAVQSRSFSICLSASKLLTAAPLIPPAALWWHFTSPTCADSSLIRLRANLSWRDAILDWTLHLIVAEQRKVSWLADLHTLFVPFPPSFAPTLIRHGAPVWHRDRSLWLRPHPSAICLFWYTG